MTPFVPRADNGEQPYPRCSENRAGASTLQFIVHALPSCRMRKTENKNRKQQDRHFSQRDILQQAGIALYQEYLIRQS